MDCWSKSESDSRYVHLQRAGHAGHGPGRSSGRPRGEPADIFYTSLTASSFVETPELRGTPIVLRAIDSTPLASFAATGITLDQDVTVNAAKTLNATSGFRPAPRRLRGGLEQHNLERQHPGGPANGERPAPPGPAVGVGPRRLLDPEGRHPGHFSCERRHPIGRPACPS